MKFIDLFCGIGGFKIGFEKSGFKSVFSSDINKNVQDTYENNFGANRNKKLRPSKFDLGDFMR